MLDLIKRECLSNATLFWKNRRIEGIKMLIKIENMFLVSKRKGLLQNFALEKIFGQMNF